MDQRIIPLVFEFLHFLDAVELAKTCRQTKSLIENLWKIEGTFSNLKIHGLDSSSEILDIKLSDWILQGPQEKVSKSLEKYNRASKVTLYNYDESSSVFRNTVLPIVRGTLKSLELHNVTFLDKEEWEMIESLKIGLNISGKFSLETIKMPKLKFLEIRGLEVSNASFRWLIEILSYTENLEFLRITVTHKTDGFNVDLISQNWNGSHLLSVELMVSTDKSWSGTERIIFSHFSNRILELSSDNPFLKIQTLTMNSSPSTTLWDRLSESCSLMHLVITNCEKSHVDLKKIASIVKSNSHHLQIFVLKFSGNSNFHFDSFIQVILSANPPLERLELEVVMDDTSCVMESPFHSIKAVTTLRCRYRNHMHFYRTRFGIVMASERAFCTDTELDVTNICSPMELFREEMVRGMMENPDDSGALEAEMINQWNLIHQVARSIYVEIYDDLIDHFLNDSSGEEKCDVSATIAYLRE